VVPATVLTSAVARSTARTQLLPVSLTKRVLPSAESARPVGLLSAAERPGPSLKPATEPASVVTVPSGATARTREAPESAT